MFWEVMSFFFGSDYFDIGLLNSKFETVLDQFGYVGLQSLGNRSFYTSLGRMPFLLGVKLQKANNPASARSHCLEAF